LCRPGIVHSRTVPDRAGAARGRRSGPGLAPRPARHPVCWGAMTDAADNQQGLPPTDPEALRREGVSQARFRAAYADAAPWDIGRPQPAIVRLADAGVIRGSVLDVGCGTGDNALMMADRSHAVLGVDYVAVAVERANAKREARGSSAEFRVHDALQLGALGRRFDTIVDCGLFHTFSDRDRLQYVDSLAAVIERGGRLILMCFSEAETREGGPRRVTQAELREAFAGGWTIESIDPAHFDATIFEGGARAWLAVIRRDESE